MENLIIPSSIRKKIINHLSQILPEEGCGLLSGTGNIVRHHFSITNTLHNSKRFLMDGKEMLQAFDWMDNHGQVLLAIYHSHPSGPALPSQTDFREDYYPDVIKIIASNAPSHWELKGFIINNENYKDVPLIDIGGTNTK
jgi:[CysO sulfur-carrier protein]-S-L-cysteine hydrolase